MSEPENHIPLVSSAKFGGHVLCYLASRFVNLVREGGRELGWMQAKNLVLEFKKFFLKIKFHT